MIDDENELLSWGHGLHLGHATDVDVPRLHEPTLVSFAEQPPPATDASPEAGSDQVPRAPSSASDSRVDVRCEHPARWRCVCAGLTSSVAVSSSGEAWSWGYSARGGLGFGPTHVQQHVPRRIGSLDREVIVSAW